MLTGCYRTLKECCEMLTFAHASVRRRSSDVVWNQMLVRSYELTAETHEKGLQKAAFAIFTRHRDSGRRCEGDAPPGLGARRHHQAVGRRYDSGRRARALFERPLREPRQPNR